jgi:hypothetical protein
MLRLGEMKQSYGRFTENNHLRRRNTDSTQNPARDRKNPKGHNEINALHDRVPKIEYSLSSREVDRRFRAALRVHQAAENVLAFYLAEIDRRKLWKELGYSSAFHYAKIATGFGDRKIHYLIYIGKKLEELRLLRNAFVDGQISWTKVREIARAATPGTERQWIEFGMKRSCREIREMATEVSRMIKKDALHFDARGQQSKRASGSTPPEPAVCARVCADLDSHSGTHPGLSENLVETAHVCINTRPIQNDPGRERSHSSTRAPGCTNGTRKDFPEEMDNGIRNAEEGKCDRIEKEDVSSDRMVRVDIAHLLTERNPSQRRIAMTLSFSPEEYQIVMQALREWKIHNPQERRREQFLVSMSRQLLKERASDNTGRSTKKRNRHSANGRRDRNGDGKDDGEREGGKRRSKIYDSPYQVVIHHCDSCGKNRIHTDRGAIEVDRSLFERALCDGKVVKIAGNGETGKEKKEPMGQNRRSVTAALRQKILLRDKHICQVPGCTHSQFLEVHHIIPKRSMKAWHRAESATRMRKVVHGKNMKGNVSEDQQGGKHAPSNLITLCSACHRLIHEGKIVVKGAVPDVRWFHENGAPFEGHIR